MPSQQRVAAVVAPPDSPTASVAHERFHPTTPALDPSDGSELPGSAVQYTNADSTELTSAIGVRPRATRSVPDSAAIVASTGAIAPFREIVGSRTNGVETSTDVVDPCTSCSEVDTKCTSTEPAVSSQNTGDEAVSTVGAVPSSCHSECDSTASRDRVTVAPSCSSTSHDDGIDRTVCVASASGQDGVVVSGSRTCVTAAVEVVTAATTTVTIGSVTDSQAVVSVACSQTDGVDTSSSTAASCAAPVVVAESSSSSIDCVTRTAAASCSCPDAGPSSVDIVSVGSDRLTEQCSVIDSGGDGDLRSSVFTADSSLEESQRQRRPHRTDDSLVECSVSQQPTISCSGSRDIDYGAGSSELVDSVSDEEVEKEEGEISDDDDDDDDGGDDDGDGACDDTVTGTAEQESRAIVHSICRRARELREAEITSSRNYYVQRSRSQSSVTDGYADSSSVTGDHRRDSQSPSRWDPPVDSTSPNQHFERNNDATSSTQGDSYRDSYVDNVHSPASSSGDASNGSLYSSEPSGPSSTCTFFGMDLPKKKVRSSSLV